MEEFFESSSIPSVQPPVDLPSSDSIDDQLNAPSLQPPNDTGEDGGDGDLGELEERESEGNGEEEEERQDGVESVNRSEKGNGNGNGNGKEGREKRRRSRFPVRPGAEDCSFYLRTGMCKFGMNCKFNHPPGRKIQAVKIKGKEESVDVAEQKVKEKDGSLDKEGQTDCKYFDRPGGCKFGKACKFNHSRKTSATVELNFMGLPIRPGEKECPYYMRTGSCKYGANCRFNHPDPTSVGGPDTLPAYGNGGSNLSSNASKSTMAPWSPPAALNESPPYMPLMFPPTQGVPSRPEWTSYQKAPAYPAERNMNMRPTYAMNGQLLDINVYAHQQEQILADEFPERPEQPECSYFMKTGNCKHRSACKFHHPKTTTTKSPACTLSDLGLPIRPGESACSYYSRYGICKYGPACKYDHPVHCAHSAPMPVSAPDETPGLGDSGVNDGAVAAGTELEAKT